MDAAGIVEQLMAAENPSAAFAELTEAQQAAVIEIQKPVRIDERVEVSVVQDALASGNGICKTQAYYRAAYGATGATLWKYISSTYFCYDGTQLITDPNFGTSAPTS